MGKNSDILHSLKYAFILKENSTETTIIERQECSSLFLRHITLFPELSQFSSSLVHLNSHILSLQMFTPSYLLLHLHTAQCVIVTDEIVLGCPLSVKGAILLLSMQPKWL